jgi:hypothetical protein
MDDHNLEWQRKGATLSDKTACAEFGLTREEIVRATGAGTYTHIRSPYLTRRPAEGI